MSRAEEFAKLRPLLYAIAYRIVGDERAARYAVQACRLRWTAAPQRPVPAEDRLPAEGCTSAEGQLAAEVARIAVRALHAARGKPVEPFLAAGPADPDRPADLAEALSLAALMVLQRLSPLERAVFVLREAFGCGDAQIAAALGCSVPACRQLLASVAVISDGGREPLPWPSCVAGAENVAALLAAIVPPLVRVGVTVRWCRVGGRPGWVLRDRGGAVLHTLLPDVRDGRIDRLHLVVHPGPAGRPGHDDPGPGGPAARPRAFLPGSGPAY
ncbi:RNA polymerase sigma-70 factor (ECF subfamily) [Streptomyces sp. 3330]|uniref:sigma factor-like helix-turn-helix DNA-binding protein n=1 Tax=Streptomyces sp. 3330 TaxID=2817755 RepID=UPI00285571DF|nr:sigma factor-like helix-turn-helix DNA-binding protein [Streptomyces sp. 3330]MDR6980667.1 RNA polymerase sigma-70 factor (ECF subfamily) [Streptomyces sp. 3330]